MNLKLEFVDKQFSPWTGLSLMNQLLDKTNIVSFLRTLSLPVQRSNRAYSPLQLIIHFWISIWCGANRFEHLEVTRHDGMIGQLFGFKKLAGHRAFQRYFAKFSQADNIKIFTAIYQSFFSQLQFDNFTLDLDSTIFCRYGNQEGAALGYNPSKPGRKSHHPLLAFVDDCRMLANFWLRPGNTHSNNNFISFLMATLRNLKGKKIGLLRAGSGFFDQEILSHLESQTTPIQYIIAARFYPGVKLSLIKHKAWLAVDKGIEIGETMYQASNWPAPRRIVIVCQKVADRPQATGKRIKKFKGKQLEIFADDQTLKVYRYSCMATNLTLPAKQIWNLYRGRADAENRIKELIEDFGIARFNTANFYQTEAALNWVMMAYNLMSLFRQATMGTKVQHTLKTLRYKVFSVAGYMTKEGNSTILKLAMKRREENGSPDFGKIHTPLIGPNTIPNDRSGFMQKWIWIGLILGSWLPTFGQSYKIHQHRGDSLFAHGHYAECLEERFKALNLVEKSGSCQQKAVGLLQIGRSYYYLQNRSEARAWLQKSLEQAISCNFDSLIGINYRNLGALFIETNKPDSAILYLEAARKSLVKARNQTEMASLCAMMFETHRLGRHDLKLARQWLDSCAHYNRQLNDPNQSAFYLIKEGIYWRDLKDFKQAEKYFMEAGDLYKSISSTDGYMYALSCQGAVQKEAKNYEKAYETVFRLMAIRDTVFKEQTAQNLARYQAQFETQKKEIENLELKRQNERQLAGFGLGILVLTLGGFGIFKIRESSHQRKLEAQKREDQRIRFSEVVQAQEEERTRIAQDLHDGLGHLMAAIKLNTSAIEVSDEYNKKILGHAGNIIDQASKEVRQISHRLMPQSLSDLGLAESIRELAHRINESGKIRVEIMAPEDISVEKQLAIGIYRIVQEVMNNALKHAGASVFTIQYSIENEDFILVLSDNGKGFDVEKIERSTGLGWKNIRSRVELLNGQMKLESKPGEGTKLEVHIPYLPEN